MDESPQPIRVNYLYFGAFLGLLALLSVSSIFNKEYYVGSRAFFLLYAFGQAVLETAGFIFLSWLAERLFGRKGFWIFIGCTFLVATLHILDYFLDRVLDLTVWNTIDFVLDESFGDFLYLLDASGLPLWAWVGFFLFLASLPFLGLALYKGSDLISGKQPLYIRREWLLQTFVCIPVALFIWDISASRVIHPDAYTAFVKSLPWKFTFIHPKNVEIEFSGPLQKPTGEQEIQAALDEFVAVPSKKPNIYLLIVESLREDFITPETAPNLHRFREEHTHPEISLSGANGTNPSWFSIFHSQFSLFWSLRRKEQWAMGSPALNLLKKWGYKIRVYTSAQLGYYGLDELVFGKDMHLVDSYQTFHHSPPVQAWETDAKALEVLQKDLSENPELQEGQVSIVFLDATHFDYSWPKQKKTPFMPFAKEIAYFRTFQSSKNIEQIKNRYRNAVHYIDSLFGSFWSGLPNRDDAVLVFLGDHGEEFFEHGHLFHNSHLIDEQMRIPLYFTFGALKKAPVNRLACQMDIFPTLIDYLSGETPSFLEGQSLFQAPKWPYVQIARFNGGRTPYEFCFHNGRNKIIARFPNQRNIFASQSLHIRSLRTCTDGDICKCKHNIETWIAEEFKGAFERFFGERLRDGASPQTPPKD